MRRLAPLVAALAYAWIAMGQEGARTAAPPLIVRKDSLRPGHFFVGVVPGVPESEPVLVEIAPEDGSPARRHRSSERRGFDLCALLRSSGIAARPGRLLVTVSRGNARYVFRIAYDGTMCTAEAPAEPPSSRGVQLRPLRLLGDEPAPAPTASVAGAPAPLATPTPVGVAVAAPSPPASPSPTSPSSPSSPRASAVAVSTPVAPATPSDVVTRAPAAPSAAPPPPAPSTAPARPPVAGERDASQRRLVPANLESLTVFLDSDRKLGTEEYRFVLRFKEPVDVEGIEECIVLASTAVRGASREFLPAGDTELIDPPDDPRQATFLSFTVNQSLALETPGVNHFVYIKVRIGSLEKAVFEARTGVKAGKKR